LHTAPIFDSFREPTVAFIPVAIPLQNEPNSHPAAQQAGRHQYGWRGPARRWLPTCCCLELGHILSAANSSANDHRERILFRVVRECDNHEPNEGSGVKARGLPANLLDQLKPEEIEPDGSDGPYGDNVIDLDDEAAERLRVSFHAQQRHHSSAPTS
jgi:hypothetical protein